MRHQSREWRSTGLLGRLYSVGSLMQVSNRPFPHERVVNADHPLAFGRRVEHLFLSADVGGEHIAGLTLWLVAGTALAAMTAVILAPVVGVVTIVLVLCCPVLILIGRLGRRQRRWIEALPESLESIARSMRSGASLLQAIGEVAHSAPDSTGHELNQLMADVNRGHSLEDALEAWTVRSSRPENRMAAAALALASQNEAGAVRALDGVSQSLRDRQALDAELASQTAQASASVQALVLLPLGFLAVDALAGQGGLSYLTSHPFGQLCLLSGLLLDAIGWLWMRHMIQVRMP